MSAFYSSGSQVFRIYCGALQHTAADTGIRQMLFLHRTKGYMLTAHRFSGKRICIHCTVGQLGACHSTVRQFGCGHAVRKKMLCTDRVIRQHFTVNGAGGQMTAQHGTSLQLV
ncbi:hypothetical protein D3C80_1785400 [compost metagenome]